MSREDRARLAREAEELGFYASLTPAELSAAWATLQVGMQKSEVRRALGDPLRYKTRTTDCTWEYADGGTVHFDWEGLIVGITLPVPHRAVHAAPERARRPSFYPAGAVD